MVLSFKIHGWVLKVMTVSFKDKGDFLSMLEKECLSKHDMIAERLLTYNRF